MCLCVCVCVRARVCVCVTWQIKTLEQLVHLQPQLMAAQNNALRRCDVLLQRLPSFFLSCPSPAALLLSRHIFNPLFCLSSFLTSLQSSLTCAPHFHAPLI